jgi:hypothetical protein
VFGLELRKLLFADYGDDVLVQPAAVGPICLALNLVLLTAKPTLEIVLQGQMLTRCRGILLLSCRRLSNLVWTSGLVAP